jgi:uncharacterized protein YjbI with pentapeptide repeats
MEQTELSLILDQHKLWSESLGLQGKRANLQSAYLARAYLGGANLWRAILTGANLRGADLPVANLTDANLTDANLWRANLTGANLRGADLSGANLYCANLEGAILPDISWIIPGCLAQLNNIKYLGFWLEKERKYENFIQDSLGFFIQDNPIEKTFDILVGDRIIRNIPHWVKYSGMKQVAAVII